MHTNSTIKINNSFILSWEKKKKKTLSIYIYIYPTLILANLAISPAMKSFLSSTYKKKKERHQKTEEKKINNQKMRTKISKLYK
jgi:formylmethanofuran dehydrogenase subunit D